jgi:hypothetical protein
MLILAAVALLSACGQSGQKNDNNMNYNVELQKLPKSVGLGTLDISFNEPVSLYASENDKQPFDVLSFEKQFDGVLLFKTKRLELLKPYMMTGGDSDDRAKANINSGLIRFPAVLAFRVLETADNFYRIVVNEETFETAIIKKDPKYAVLPQRDLVGLPNVPKDKPYKGYYIYETWEHLLLRAAGLYFHAEYEVYDKPDGEIINHKKGRDDHFRHANEINGDWIKVNIMDKNIKTAEGWVRWKNDKEILIEIIEFAIM